jgi:hypothetical protein
MKDGDYVHRVDEAPFGAITSVCDVNTRLKWQVGLDYAVSPGRGKRTAMVLWHWLRPTEIVTYRLPETAQVAETLASQCGYKPLRIRITAIERVRLHDMDERVALAEGVGSVAEYEALWRTINATPGTRWEDNPLVWRLWFEVA